MRLCDAPTIVTNFWGPELEAAAAKVRAIYADAPKDGGDLRKLAQDVWALDRPIDLHTDKTAKGHYVFGVVLVNDPGLVLYAEGVIYDVPIGTVYAIDGHRRHGALAHNCLTAGLFGFMAWDVPRHFDIDELIADIAPSMLAWANDEPRINVLQS